MEAKHVKTILRWIWLLALFPVITIAIGYFYTNAQPKQYEAITTLLIGPGIDSPNPDLDALRAGAQLMETYTELPQTDSFLETIIDDLDLDLTKADLEDLIDIRPSVDTQVLRVVIVDSDADRAVAIANAVSNQLVVLGPSTDDTNFFLNRIEQQAERIEEDIVTTEERINILTEQLEIEVDISKQNLIIQQIADQEQQLSEANTTLATLYEILQTPLTNRIQIIDPAEEANVLRTPLALNMVAAVLAGSGISVAVAAFLILYENTLVNVDGLANFIDVPVWGVLPDSKSSNLQLTVDAAPQSQAAKQYYQLGARILYGHDFENIHSLLIGSLDPKRQASEVACNLAVTVAKTDADVYLLDVNLRSDFISDLFDLKEAYSLSDAFESKEGKAQFTEVRDLPHLKVLPSGISYAEKLFDLLASSKMHRILENAKSMDGMLMVAAPPLSSLEDSLTLASRVDGVVLLIGHRRMRLAQLKQAIANLEALGGQVVGIIVNKSSF